LIGAGVLGTADALGVDVFEGAESMGVEVFGGADSLSVGSALRSEDSASRLNGGGSMDVEVL
jgi:hypothetical protein